MEKNIIKQAIAYIRYTISLIKRLRRKKEKAQQSYEEDDLPF